MREKQNERASVKKKRTKERAKQDAITREAVLMTHNDTKRQWRPRRGRREGNGKCETLSGGEGEPAAGEKCTSEALIWRESVRLWG